MSAHSDKIANADDNANANAAPPRTRRGPAFSLNPIAHHGSYSQFATPPRFQFSNNDEKNETPSSGGQARRNIFRSLNRQFEHASPFEGGRRIAPRISDDEIEDDPVSAPDKKQKNQTVSDRDFLEDASNVLQRSMKRPRMSLWPAHASQAVTSDLIKDVDMNNEINDSSSPTPDSPVSPPARHKFPKSMSVTPLHADDELSAVKSIEEIPGPQTPNQISSNIDHGHSVSKTTSSIRNRPKFILSANYTPTSQDTSITSTAPFARKKPAFVIPRSPSPSQENLSSIPTPFSPAKIRTLHRPGRPKSLRVSAGYVSDGMAEHLRDWILETDMKRTATSGQRTQGAQNIERFMLIGRIQSCHNAFLRSSGPVVMATVIPERLEKGLEQRLVHNKSEIVSLLLLGVAVSQASTNSNRQSDPRQKLKPGDIIGVGAGLSWEIEIGTSPAHRARFGDRPGDSEVVASLESDPYHGPESEANRMTTSLVDAADIRPQKWLVTAEWDLVERCA